MLTSQYNAQNRAHFAYFLLHQAFKLFRQKLRKKWSDKMPCSKNQGDICSLKQKADTSTDTIISYQLHQTACDFSEDLTVTLSCLPCLGARRGQRDGRPSSPAPVWQGRPWSTASSAPRPPTAPCAWNTAAPGCSSPCQPSTPSPAHGHVNHQQSVTSLKERGKLVVNLPDNRPSHILRKTIMWHHRV